MAKKNISIDSALAPLVGGGVATGTTLLLRGFVPPIPEGSEYTVEEPHWAFKYAGLLGGAAGILGSLALGYFRGWGEAVTGGICAGMAAANAQLYNTVVAEENRSSYMGYMVSRPAAYGQPAIYGRTRRLGRRGLRGFMVNRAVAGELPENVTAFPNAAIAGVNMKAFGGGSF